MDFWIRIYSNLHRPAISHASRVTLTCVYYIYIGINQIFNNLRRKSFLRKSKKLNVIKGKGTVF